LISLVAIPLRGSMPELSHKDSTAPDFKPVHSGASRNSVLPLQNRPQVIEISCT
jgi:hypothetical protein